MERLNELKEEGLVAEVWHRANYRTMTGPVGERDILIGRAKVAVSGLFLRESVFGEFPSIDGFYHI